MPATQRFVTVFLPVMEGQQDDAYARHDGGRTLERWRLMLRVARDLKFDGVRAGVEFFRYARHPLPEVQPYAPYVEAFPIVDLVAPTGLKLLVNITPRPWRENWSQLAGYSGTNESIGGWWARTGGLDYDEWMRRNWPNEARPPEALWPAMAQGAQSLVDALVKRWQMRGRKPADLQFAFWQEPDGAGGFDQRTLAQAEWGPDFHAMMNYLLLGRRAIDFHEHFLWSPAFASGVRPTNERIEAAGRAGDLYWRRFNGLAFNCYRLDMQANAANWPAALAERAKREVEAFRARPTTFGTGRPLSIHEFGVTSLHLGRRENDEEVGRKIAEGEKRLIEMGAFDLVALFALNEISAQIDANPAERYGFATSFEGGGPNWYRRLLGYAQSWGVTAFDAGPPSGMWRM